MKTLGNAVPLVTLAALAASGCFLVSGQFVVNYVLPTPLLVVGGSTLTGVSVDLNTIRDYSDHKNDLKRVDDLALIGDFKNNNTTPTNVEAWLVAAGTLNLTSAQLAANGVKLWGPLSVAGSGTQHVDWNRSASLFVGRQSLIDEIKGDGKFSLYIIANGTFNVTVTSGAVIAVVSAAK